MKLATRNASKPIEKAFALQVTFLALKNIIPKNNAAIPQAMFGRFSLVDGVIKSSDCDIISDQL